jgi:UDP-glucose-4-epimerase GalE
MNFEGRTVLVTGGAGYIGSHTCKALKKAGYIPVVYDNLSGGHIEAVKWGPLEVGDILDKARLDGVMRKYAPQAVMHFASLISVGESVSNPQKYYRNNVEGSLSLLSIVGRHGVKRFIFSSTAAVYGIPEAVPIEENAPHNPINPYGRTKLAVEYALQDYAQQFGVGWTVLRYFNAAGADPEGEIGEAHEPETHLIPLVLEAIAGRRNAVMIYGTDYDTADGTCIRDYVHVSDLADAHVLALRHLERGGRSNVFNLGNGDGFSVREVIKAAEKVTGYGAPVEFGARRAGDPATLVASSKRAREILNWSPRHSSLEEIIDTAWAWLRLRDATFVEDKGCSSEARSV